MSVKQILRSASRAVETPSPPVATVRSYQDGSADLTTTIIKEMTVSVNDISESSTGISTLTPNRHTRLLEKETLSNLNDRLAVYIDRVRHLEMENARLNGKITESEMVEKQEREDLISRYEFKIEELRDMMDEALKDKTRHNMDAKTAAAERDTLRTKASKLEKDLKELEKGRMTMEGHIQDLQGRVKSAEGMRRHLEDQNKGLLSENTDVNGQLKVLRKQVEDEAVLNTALHNQNQSLKEDYDFLQNTHQGRLNEILRKRQVEMTTTTRDIERTYESRLREQLQAMRAEFDNRLNKNRRDIDETYTNKMHEANEARQHATAAREESARLQLRIQELDKNAATHDRRIDVLNKIITDLENQLRFARDDADVRIQQRDMRIGELQQEIERILSEYQDLFEIKVQLATELNAYQSLLEGEETRLNISQQSSTSPEASLTALSNSAVGDVLPRSAGVKRKRLTAPFFQSADKTYQTIDKSECDVEIEAHDTNGKFVRLVNKGKEAFPVGEWSIQSVASERETVYKFHSRQVIKPTESVTIWSADSGEKSVPPSQLVMKNQQWPAGGHVKTLLINSDGGEMAMRESWMQEGQLVQDPDQRCSLM